MIVFWCGDSGRNGNSFIAKSLHIVVINIDHCAIFNQPFFYVASRLFIQISNEETVLFQSSVHRDLKITPQKKEVLPFGSSVWFFVSFPE